MDYIATLNIDYTRTKQNEYQKLLVALEHAGWDYVETSAMLYQGPDLDAIRRGLMLLSNFVHKGGNLSALNIQVQAVAEPRSAPTDRKRENAYADIASLPGPPNP